MNSERINQLTDIPLTTGAESSQKLENGQRNYRVELTIAGIADVSADATALRNRGSILGSFGNVNVSVDGENRFSGDARAYHTLAECMRGRQLPRKRASALTAAAAAEPIYEVLPIDFAHPGIAVPEETAFLERSTNTDMTVSVTPLADPSKLFRGGTGLLTGVSVKVRQISDPFRGGSNLPLLRPRVRQLSAAVVSDGSLDIDLSLTRYLGGILIQQDSSEGEVSDIIRSFQLVGEGGATIIPKSTPWADFVRHNMPVGIDGEPIGGYAYAYFNPLKMGRLSKLIHPQLYPHMKLVVDALPSVTNAAIGSRIRVLVLEYEFDPQLTAKPSDLPFKL